MSDKMRWRYGDTNPVVAAVDSGTVIEIGDLLWQDVNDAKPASELRPDVEQVKRCGCGKIVDISSTKTHICPKCGARGNWETIPRKTLQELFADNFLGVAMQRSRSGDTDPLRVAATGVFELDCPSGTFELGDFVGVCCVDGVGQIVQPKNQQVASVSASQYAIGRVAKRVATAATSLLVDVRSTVMTGGVKGSV